MAFSKLNTLKCLHLSVSDYVEKKRKASNKWASVKEEVKKAFIEDECPAIFTCLVCEAEEQDIWRCKDCGPTAYFCTECCRKHHLITLFHKPQQWRNDVCILNWIIFA